MSPPAFDGIDYTVQRVFATDPTPLIALATALVVWDMTWAVNMVMQALNRVQEVEERRSKARRIAVAAGLGFAVVACLIAAVLVQSAAPAIAAGALDAFLSVLRWPVSVLFLWAAVTLVLRYAPAENRDLGWASAGSLLVIAAWLAASALFRVWVTDVASLKSAAGSLTVFLLLTSYVFVSTMILLLGAELDELARRKNLRS